MSKGFTKREITGSILLLTAAALLAFLVRHAELRTAEERAQTVSISPTTTIAEEIQTELRPFDPNTADYELLRSLGMSRQEAVSLLKFRASGKVFRIAEDVALCYGISDSAYRGLAPYIIIGEEFRIKRSTYTEQHNQAASREEIVVIDPTPFRIDTVTAAYLRAIGAFTKRQAEAFIRWRDRSGFRDMEEVRACYVVDDSVATALEPYILFPERDLSPYEAPIDLNRADSAQLVRVVGIGPKSAMEILRYRERLGGFLRVEQLAEVKGVTEANYEKILQQICCKADEIRKIDINFATPSELDHPYIGPQLVRKLIKHRQLKGGWTCTQELVEQHILTKEEAERLDPYLVFGVQKATSE
ncbi:MAG: helix-hairpin-helix domain-containing protein [Alistipes sp.]|nr:helix-hairpin-helix domain-containing protein [Alistipes sp.]